MRKESSSGLSVYLHFPFCIRKCNYCDFTSFTLTTEALKYIAYLNREIDLFFDKYPESKMPIKTIYFGGGTPSLMSPDQLYSVLNNLHQYFDFSSLVEFTLEANPETVESVKFNEYHGLGINRLSLGAQSFNDTTLNILGRVHTAKKTYEAFEIVRKQGFNNISVDLMFGLPGESYSENMRSLLETINLLPEHISYYALTIERKTQFYKKRNQLTLPSDNTSALEYTRGINALKKGGFTQYEISNFAKAGFESKHNLTYWHGLPYLGFGLGAAGFFGRKRWKNVSNLQLYFTKIENKKLPISSVEHLKGQRQKGEYIMTNLRLLKGVNKNGYYARFGVFPSQDFQKEINYLKEEHLLIENPLFLKLTKKGLLFANQAMQMFI